MNKTNIFDAYFVVKTDKKIIIRAKLSYHGLEKFGFISILLILFIFLSPSIPIIFNSILLTFLIRLLITIILYIIIVPYLKRLLAYTILVYFKEKNIIAFGTDGDSINVLEINNIEIVEEEFFDAVGNIYKLKFNLSGGEKTSSFAFSTFAQAKSLADIIMGEFKNNS